MGASAEAAPEVEGQWQFLKEEQGLLMSASRQWHPTHWREETRCSGFSLQRMCCPPCPSGSEGSSFLPCDLPEPRVWPRSSARFRPRARQKSLRTSHSALWLDGASWNSRPADVLSSGIPELRKWRCLPVGAERVTLKAARGLPPSFVQVVGA